MSKDTRRRALAALVVASGVIAYGVLLSWPVRIGLGDLPLAGVLTAAAVALSMVSVSIGPATVNASLAGVMLALLAVGPGAAVIALAVSSAVSSARHRPSRLRWVYSCAHPGLSLAVLTLTYGTIAGPVFGSSALVRIVTGGWLEWARYSLAVAVGIVGFVAVRVICVGRYVELEGRAFPYVRVLQGDTAGSLLVGAVGAGLALIAADLGWALTVLFALPALGLTWAGFHLLHARVDGTFSVARRLTMFWTAGTGAIFLAVSAVALQAFRGSYGDALVHGGISLARAAVTRAQSEGVLRFDGSALRDLASADVDIAYAGTTDASGRWTALSIAPRLAADASAIDAAVRSRDGWRRPLPLGGDRVLRVREAAIPLPDAGGDLRLGIDLSDADAAQRQLGLALGAATALLFTVMLLGLRYYALTRLVGPLGVAGAALRAIADGAGDLRHRLPEAGDREIAGLSREFNRFVGGLESLVGATGGTARGVAQGAQDLAATTQELSASATAVSASVEDSATRLEREAREAEVLHGLTSELEALSREAARLTAGARHEAEAVVRSVEQSRGELGRTGEALLEVRAAVREAEQSGGDLIRVSAEIRALVDTIRTMAAQTNLLALNAAIEAARAGEQGRGFGVVAEEVRKLADGSAKAARQAGTLVEEISARADRLGEALGRSAERVEKIEQASAASSQVLGVIVTAVHRIDAAIEELAGGVGLQREIAGRVEAEVRTIEELLREDAALASEVLAAAQEQSGSTEQMALVTATLAEQARELEELAGRFKTDNRPAPAIALAEV